MPTKGSWGGSLKDIIEKDKKIGDDIERIRLVRSEILHLSPFEIDKSRYKVLCRLVRDVAKRMELNNNKNTDYTNDVKDILQQGVSNKQFEEQEKGIKHGNRNIFGFHNFTCKTLYTRLFPHNAILVRCNT